MKKILCLLLTAMLLITGVVIVPFTAAALDITPPADTTVGDHIAPRFIGVQTQIVNAGTDDETQNIRFVATVPNTNGKALGYDIYVSGTSLTGDQSYNIESSTVYTSILAGGETIQASDYGAEALFVAVIKGVPTNLTNIQFDVRTYVAYGEDSEARSFNTTFEMNNKDFQKTLTSPSFTWATQGGRGTEENPYVLTNDNFVDFYEYYYSYVPKGNGDWTNVANAFNGEHFSLESDVTVNTGNASDWATATGRTAEGFKEFDQPLGDFNGSFDGNGKTISGLCVTHNGRAALFQSIKADGTLKNLRVVNSLFDNETNAGSYTRGGTFAADLNGGRIENCYSEALVASTTTSGSNISVGGIVGMVNGNNSVIYGCVFNGEVKVDNSTFMAGGIVGKINGSVQNTLIENCQNIGTVTGPTAGGIVGKNEGTNTTLKYCESTGTVTGTTTGDIIGDNTGHESDTTITNTNES